MDTVIVERARAGDREALQELLEHIAPLVRRFAVRMCGHEADVDDVLQDTLLGVVIHLGEFEGRASLATWAFQLARTACARRRRGLKNQRHASLEMIEEPAAAGTPEAAASDQQLRDALSRALTTLSDEHREVLLLRDMEGLSAPEVAEILGTTVQAVKSRLHRARVALRDKLRSVLERDAPTPRPDCPDVLAAFSRKLEGDLAQEDCATMERHIGECPACRSACSALRSALFACRAEANGQVSPELQEQLRAAVRKIVA